MASTLVTFVFAGSSGNMENSNIRKKSERSNVYPSIDQKNRRTFERLPEKKNGAKNTSLEILEKEKSKSLEGEISLNSDPEQYGSGPEGL